MLHGVVGGSGEVQELSTYILDPVDPLGIEGWAFVDVFHLLLLTIVGGIEYFWAMMGFGGSWVLKLL